MKNIRLIVLDLDGTVLTEAKEIHPRVREAVRRLLPHYRITFATGRSFPAARPYARELDIREPLIVLDGGLVKPPEGGPPLYRAPIPATLSRKILGQLLDQGVFFVANAEEGSFLSPQFAEHARELSRWGEAPHVGLPNPETPVYRIIVVAERPHLERLREHLASLPLRIALYPFRTGGNWYLDIRHPEATKGKALERLMAHLGLRREEVLAFGDYYNDLELFEVAGVRVAVANAVPPLKEQADFVTAGTNEEGGIAELLERLVAAKAAPTEAGQEPL